MSATIVQQLYSQNHWANIDGVQTIWNFTFSGGYIFKEHVKAYYTDELDSRYPVTITEDMFIGEYQLQIIPAIPASATRFVIYRDTPKDLPLVDFEGGAVQSEANLDRGTKQAVFVVAELLDEFMASGIALDQFGFKALQHVPHTGASVLATHDNGRAHFKTDATGVTVPNTLPDEFLSTIINHHAASSMTVTFTDSVGVMQGGSPSGKASWVLAPRQTLSVTKVASGFFYISGNAS